MNTTMWKLLRVLGVHSTVRAARHWLDMRAPTSMSCHKQRLRLYSGFVEPGDLCFDVGAHVGLVTRVLLSLRARVVCIEPQNSCLKALRRNFGGVDGVTIVEGGLSDKAGWTELWICEDRPTISTMSQDWRQVGRYAVEGFQWARSEKVELTTLDALIAEYGRPAFCKIDVEGMELPVLKGLSQPIPHISLEFSRELLDDTRKCLDHLMSIGPAEFNYTLEGSTKLVLCEWVKPDEFLQILGAIDNSLAHGDIYVRYRNLVNNKH